MAFDPTAAANQRRQAQQDEQRKAHEMTVEYAQNLGTDIVIKVQDMIDRLDTSKPTFDSDAHDLTVKFMAALHALNATPVPAPANPGPVTEPQPATPAGTAAEPAPADSASVVEPAPADEPEPSSDRPRGFLSRAIAKAKEIDNNSKVR